MNAEIFRPIQGFCGYEVSNLGRVRSFKSGAYRIRTSHRDSSGYLRVTLWRDGKEHNLGVHILVLETFVGPRPPGNEARHVLNNNRSDCRLENLAWGTPKQNAADRKVHGTENTGSRNGAARLTEKQVQEIRQARCAGKIEQRELASRYGVGESTISRILRGSHWKGAGGSLPATTRATKLTTEEVRQIWAHRNILEKEHLAQLFGVTRGTVRKIHDGKAWSHVTGAGGRA